MSAAASAVAHFSFTLLESGGASGAAGAAGALAPRLGLLRHAAGAPPTPTPACLLYSRKGAPVCHTPDLLPPAGEAPLQLNAGDFLEKPSTSVVAKVAARGAREWAAIDADRLITLAPRDAAAPAPPAGANDKHLIYSTINGHHRVNTDAYLNIAKAVQPDVLVAMADEQPPTASESRARAAVFRTLKQLDSLLGAGVADAARAVFGNVQGAAHEVERKRSAEETAKRPVDGFFIGGFGLGEPPAERHALLHAALEPLPAEKPRYLAGVGSPLEILEAVALGVDMFDSAYPHEMACQGYALDLPTSLPEKNDAAAGVNGGEHGKEAAEAAAAGELPGKLNLRSRAYSRDARPLVSGCTCACCSAHTRAYMHHMLQCHELAGEVLLNVHNAANFAAFLGAVREAIAAGRFEEFAEYTRRRLHGDDLCAERVQLPS